MLPGGCGAIAAVNFATFSSQRSRMPAAAMISKMHKRRHDRAAFARCGLASPMAARLYTRSEQRRSAILIYAPLFHLIFAIADSSLQKRRRRYCGDDMLA